MEQLFLAALIACTSGQATCTMQDAGAYNLVYACDVAPGREGTQQFRANIDGTFYVVVLQAECDDA